MDQTALQFSLCGIEPFTTYTQCRFYVAMGEQCSSRWYCHDYLDYNMSSLNQQKAAQNVELKERIS